MTDWKKPADNSTVADPPEDEDAGALLHAADASGAPVDDEVVPPLAHDADVVRTSSRSRPTNLSLLVAGILLVGIAQLVLSWFILTATNRAGDQQALANGLQRCLISAQLSNNSTADPQGTAYRATVQACLNK